MISLQESLTSNINIDGHTHLFDKDKCIYDFNYTPMSKVVGFIDIEPLYMDKYESVGKLYEKFIEEHYDKEKHILLLSGTNIDDIKKVYDKHPSIYKGFGEIKCYDKYGGRDINTKKISFIDEICRFSSSVGDLPIYIHYSLTDKKYVDRLCNLLNKYPNIPIILCHCGMEVRYEDRYDYTNDDIYDIVVGLMRKYPNLWVDLTFTASSYFVKNIMKIFNMDKSRLILGTDINVFALKKESKNIDKYISNYNLLSKYIPESNENINRLFGK